MEVAIRVAAAALLATSVCLLLKRRNPELLIPLSVVVCIFAFHAAAGALRPVISALDKAKALSGLGEAYFLPVLKCVAIGLITKAAADLCRDGSQTAMAGAVELGGTAAALFVSLPLLQTLLGLLEKLL